VYWLVSLSHSFNRSAATIPSNRFCGRATHTIAGCEQHKGMGDVISELGKFREELSDGRMVSQTLPPGVQSIGNNRDSVLRI
jgi:hypothetical protein